LCPALSASAAYGAATTNPSSSPANLEFGGSQFDEKHPIGGQFTNNFSGITWMKLKSEVPTRKCRKHFIPIRTDRCGNGFPRWMDALGRLQFTVGRTSRFLMVSLDKL